MRTLGTLLLLVGIVSTILYFLHMNFIFLRWVDQRGPGIGWLIRSGLLVLGIIFYFVGTPSEEE
ncbi:MAG: hypothetical protein ABJC12_07700 [Saprospiraceae bacterium]